MTITLIFSIKSCIDITIQVFLVSAQVFVVIIITYNYSGKSRFCPCPLSHLDSKITSSSMFIVLSPWRHLSHLDVNIFQNEENYVLLFQSKVSVMLTVLEAAFEASGHQTSWVSTHPVRGVILIDGIAFAVCLWEKIAHHLSHKKPPFFAWALCYFVVFNLCGIYIHIYFKKYWNNTHSPQKFINFQSQTPGRTFGASKGMCPNDLVSSNAEKPPECCCQGRASYILGFHSNTPKKTAVTLNRNLWSVFRG